MSKNDKLKKNDKSVQIMGITISGTERDRVLKRMFLQRKNLLHIATVNPEFVMQAKDSKKFKRTLEAVEETVADGVGVVLALKILEGKKVDRITGGMLVDEILKKADKDNQKIFLLGASEGVAEEAAKRMKSRYPGIEIASYEGAKAIISENRAEAGMTLAKINSFEPDYLLVAYGSPWQDIWIEENRPYLRVKVAIGIGGVLDEWAGKVKNCPRWIEQAGFKWLWRLVHEPWRWRRQVRLVRFMFLVATQWFKK